MRRVTDLQREVVGALADPEGAERPVEALTLRAGSHRAEVLSFGAHLSGWWTPDAHGGIDNVVSSWRTEAGQPDLSAYADPVDHPYLGATVGRYANRIAGARYEIDGVEHRLDANEGVNQLHGGPVGFDRRHWSARGAAEPTSVWVELTMSSPDGDQGHPGRLEVSVTYRLHVTGELRIVMEATTTRPTAVNLTNHAYWNLDGTSDPGAADLDQHDVTVVAEHVVEIDAQQLPTGRLLEVPDTVFDLRRPTRCTELTRHPELATTAGIDHCLMRDRPELDRVHARLSSRRSGRSLVLRSDQPGLQVYAANHGAGPLGAHRAMCLEAQLPPDAPNQTGFPDPVLRPGQRYRHEQRWRMELLTN